MRKGKLLAQLLQCGLHPMHALAIRRAWSRISRLQSPALHGDALQALFEIVCDSQNHSRSPQAIVAAAFRSADRERARSRARSANQRKRGTSPRKYVGAADVNASRRDAAQRLADATEQGFLDLPPALCISDEEKAVIDGMIRVSQCRHAAELKGMRENGTRRDKALWTRCRPSYRNRAFYRRGYDAPVVLPDARVSAYKAIDYELTVLPTGKKVEAYLIDTGNRFVCSEGCRPGVIRCVVRKAKARVETTVSHEWTLAEVRPGEGWHEVASFGHISYGRLLRLWDHFGLGTDGLHDAKTARLWRRDVRHERRFVEPAVAVAEVFRLTPVSEEISVRSTEFRRFLRSSDGASMRHRMIRNRPRKGEKGKAYVVKDRIATPLREWQWERQGIWTFDVDALRERNWELNNADIVDVDVDAMPF